MNQRKTKVENLPPEMLRQKRFFPAEIRQKPDGRIEKFPMIKAWNELRSLMTAEAASQRSNTVGFATAVEDDDDPVLFFDFDAVLNDDGYFVNSDARAVFEVVTNSLGKDCYVERSISGHGLHIFAKPTANKFGKITNDRFGTLHLDENNSKIKLEIFYKTAARYCLLTGNRFRTSGDKIPTGKNVDDLLTCILAAVKKNLPNDDVRKPQEPKAFYPLTADAEEYDKYRAEAMLTKISCSLLDDSDWLKVMAACKGLVDYARVDAWNKTDPDRYRENENRKRWDSLDGKSTVATLHALAKRFGYDEKSARLEWYKMHPEYSKPLASKSIAPCQGDNRICPEPIVADGRPFNVDDYIFEARTDYDNARRLEKFCGDCIRWLEDESRWLFFKNGIWGRGSDKASVILPMVFALRGKIQDATEKLDDGKKKYATAVVKDFSSQKKINAAVSLLKGCGSIIIKADDLNKHPELLNCQNGVVDLQTGKLYPSDPKLMLTQQTSVDYDPRADSTAFDKFFEEIMPDEMTREGLLRWLGYCLTGSVREEKFLIWRGAGGNGKGVLTRTLTNLLKDYSATLPRGAFVLKPFDDGNAHTAALNSLENARFAIVAELQQTAVLDSALLKNLTGGDLQTFRPMYSEFKNVTPTAKLNMSTNHNPRFENVDDVGILRRALIMPFEVSFKDRPDPRLKERLLLPENLRGLLKILIDESVIWYREGLVISDKMKIATEEILSASDFVTGFISDFCEIGEGYRVSRRKLLGKLKEVCKEAHRFTDKEIALMFEKRGFEYTKNKGVMCYHGLKLLETD